MGLSERFPQPPLRSIRLLTLLVALVAVGAAFGVPTVAQARSTSIPMPRRNACQLVSASTISAIVGTAAAIQSQPSPFQLSPGLTVPQVAISLCSFTFGTASNTLLPTLSITYFATATGAGASREFNRIKSMLGATGWRKFTNIGDAAFGRLDPRGGADFMTLHGNQFLQISLAATNVSAPLAKVKRVAVKAAATAWPRRRR